MTGHRGPLRRRLKAARMAVKDPLISTLSRLSALGLDRHPRSLADLERNPPRNILVIRSDRIGDLLCSSPLMEALHRRWPDAKITLLGGPPNRAAMPFFPYLVRAPVEFARHPWSWARLAAWLPRQGFDLAVSLRAEVFSGAWIAALTCAPTRMVTHATRAGAAFNFILGLDEPHQTRRYWLAASRLGVELPGTPRAMIEVPAAAAARADAFVGALAVPPQVPLVGVGMPNRSTVRHRRRAWSADRLVELVRRLSDGGARVLLFGVGAELQEARAIVGRVPGATIVPPSPLPVVAGIQRHLALLVTSFTGTMHVAGAVGTPTVALGEAGIVADWRLLGPLHRAVAAANPADIPVEAVLAEVREALKLRMPAAVPEFGATG